MPLSYGIKNSFSGNEFCIVKARINEFENVTDITALINEQGEPYDMWNLYNDRIGWSLYGAYAWIPHRYATGDVVVFTYDNTFAVVVEDNRSPIKTTGLDMNDMTESVWYLKRTLVIPAAVYLSKGAFHCYILNHAKNQRWKNVLKN